MNLHRIAFTVLTGLALAGGGTAATRAAAASASDNDQESRAATIGRVMRDWQSRILASNLPVEDARNWALRNMAKFSRLDGERVSLAQRAATLGELELVLMDAPIGTGSRLDVLMANQRGDITMLGARGIAKSSPALVPSAYSDLVFTALTPCRILDSRASQGGSGPWVAGSSNTVKIGPYPTGYATGVGAQGGSATSCGLDSLAGPGQVAVIMAAVSTVSQTGAGYLTFYPQGAPNPGTASVSQFYQPGYVQTSFVLIPTDLAGAVAASGFTSAGTEVIIDVVGYFAAPGNITLVQSTASTGNILKGENRFIHNFGSQNTFIGENAGNFSITGYGNTGTGMQTLTMTTTGYANTATGAGAMADNMTGTYNTATGYLALLDNSSGSYNTATGASAMQVNTTGSQNTASGDGALGSNTTGNNNTADGLSAMAQNSIGSDNTAVGFGAISGNTTGSNNIAIGSGTGQFSTTGSFNILIGNPGVAAEGNTIRIGYANQTKAFIAGIRGVTTGGAGIPVLIDINGQLGTVSSSRRFKDDLADMDSASSALMKLRPVTFHYKADQGASGRTLQYGLVAEEVAQVYPGLVAHSADGQVETVMYQFLPPMLLNEVQKQQRIIEIQSAQIAELTRRTEQLAKELERRR